MTPMDLVSLLSSILVGLSACTESGQKLSVMAVQEISEQAVMNVLGESILELAHLSFEDLSTWYNSGERGGECIIRRRSAIVQMHSLTHLAITGGYKAAPWMELQSLDKWDKASSSAATPLPNNVTPSTPLSQYFLRQELQEEELEEEEQDEEDEGEGEEEEDDETHDPGAETVFHFPLFPDARGGMDGEFVRASLTIVMDDVASLLDAAIHTGLSECDPSVMAKLFLESAAIEGEGGLLSKASFDAVIRKVVAGHALTAQQKHDYSQLLSAVFHSFDGASTGQVDALELSAGFSLLCEGSKSAKLAFVFELVDEDGDDALDLRGLWKMLRSILMVMLGISWGTAHCTPEELSDIADSASAWLCTKIFKELGLDENASIQFDELATWYTDGGSEAAAFLELLDLSKWALPPKPVSGSSHWQQDEQEEGEAEDSVLSEGGSASEALFSFELCPGLELIITAEDIDIVQRVVFSSKLSSLSPEDMMNMLQSAVQGGDCISQAAFADFVSYLQQPDSEVEDAQRLLKFAMGNIYYALERMQTQRRGQKAAHGVPLQDIACALTLLCCGRKSEKLAFAFGLYEVEETASQEGIHSFLRCMLTAISACVRHMLDFSNPKVRNQVNQAASHVCSSIFVDPSSAYVGAQRMSFEDFGGWYNDGGFKLASWLEMLNLNKWLPAFGEEPDSPGPSEASQPEDQPEEGAAARTNLPPDSQAISARFYFQVSDSRNPVHLLIGTEDAKAVTDLAERTGLAYKEARAACTTLVRSAHGGMIDKPSFDACVKSLVAGDARSGRERSIFNILLSSIFYSFDRDDTSCVDVYELAAGFSILCAGSKSTKLSLAFELLDEDGDDLLSRRGMWRFIRAFLTTLMALSFASQKLSGEELARAVDEGAVWTSARIFADVEADDTIPAPPMNKLSFDHFAKWYSDGGFKVAPWLELLSLSKWGGGAGLQ